MNSRSLLPIILLCLAPAAAADWKDDLRRWWDDARQPATQAALADSEILAGLKEALAQGATRAINTLGRTDGFWANAGVRIPLPDSVARIEKAARGLGQGALVDQFHQTLNRAAEQAVPQVADIFGDAVRQMTIEDARAILQGAPDAATQFFRRTTRAPIYAKVLPIVQGATQQVGVTAQYKRMAGSFGPLLQRAGVQDADLDAFVTHKALDGLYSTIAAEEARIRADPAARGSEILRRVFGAK